MSGRTLQGQAAIVLGAETPAGQAAAIALAEAGARVAVIAATAEGAAAFALRSLARRVAEASGIAAPSQAIDASIGTAVRVAMKQITKELGPPAIFVCATDAPFVGGAARVSDAQWARVVGANLNSVFFGLRLAMAELAAEGVALVIAHQAEHAARAAPEYDATKAAVVALVSGLAREPGAKRMYALTAAAGAPETVGELVVRLASGDADDPAGTVFGMRPVQ